MKKQIEDKKKIEENMLHEMQVHKKKINEKALEETFDKLYKPNANSLSLQSSEQLEIERHCSFKPKVGKTSESIYFKNKMENFPVYERLLEMQNVYLEKKKQKNDKNLPSFTPRTNANHHVKSLYLSSMNNNKSKESQLIEPDPHNFNSILAILNDQVKMPDHSSLKISEFDDRINSSSVINQEMKIQESSQSKDSKADIIRFNDSDSLPKKNSKFQFNKFISK